MKSYFNIQKFNINIIILDKSYQIYYISSFTIKNKSNIIN
ncbi:hypothetical protein pb186bvf_006565 [Paramecium bursaria]